MPIVVPVTSEEDFKPSLLLDFANTKEIDPRLNFSRGSVGSYWSDKQIRSSENLIKQSSSFNSYWGYDGNDDTLTKNSIVSPRGAVDGHKFTVGTAYRYHGVDQNVYIEPGEQYTLSGFIRRGDSASTSSFAAKIQLQSRQDGSFVAGTGDMSVNLDEGTANVTSGDSGNLKSLGDGWFYATLTATAPASGSNQFQARIEARDSADNSLYAGNGTDHFYVSSFQLEQRSKPSGYTETQDDEILNNITLMKWADSNEARFDHDPITRESLGVLLEEARTTYGGRSENFEDWDVKSPSVRIISKEAVAPDGERDATWAAMYDSSVADAMIETQMAISPSSTTKYCFSIFAKKVGAYSTFEMYNFFTSVSTKGSTAQYNFDNDTFHVNSADGGGIVPTNYGREIIGDGWVRLWYVSYDANSGENTGLGFRFYPGSRSTGIVGSFLVWGAQIEVGDHPTSYIRTPNNSSSITRAKEELYIAGSDFTDFYNQDEGTFYVEADAKYNNITNTNYRRFFEVSNENLNNRLNLYVSPVSDTLSGAINTVGTVAPVTLYDAKSLDGSTPIVAPFKAAMAYQTNNSALCIDGGTLLTDSDGMVRRTVRTQMHIGSSTIIGSPSAIIDGHVFKLAYYPKRLSNATLRNITE